MALITPQNLPAGSVIPFAGATEPAGWLFMYGQAISRATYAALFAAIGTTYGAGDGSTTFNVPDARGRALFGKDNMGGSAANRITSGGGGLDGATLGAVGGSETKTLTAAQIPSHTHDEQLNTGGANYTYGSSGTGALTRSLLTGPTVDFTADGTVTTVAAGSGGAHSVVAPAIVINYIIKT